LGERFWDGEWRFQGRGGVFRVIREHGRRGGTRVEMDFRQTTGDLPMLLALALMSDHRRKLLILTALSFLALC
jgi:hypothetical protein